MNYLFVFLMSGSFFASCAGTELKDKQGTFQKVKTIYREVSAAEFKRGYVNGFLLDVRTPDEFKEGHIAGAVNLNIYDADFSDQLDQLDKSKPIYVYCKSGGRSTDASDMMSAKGFKAVYNLVGGYSAYPYK
jgi:phage shock protein E